MKTDITPKTKAQMTDPHLDLVMDRLFDGKDATAFQKLTRLYLAWKLDSEAQGEEYLSREEFFIALDEMIEHASECVREHSSEDAKNAYHEEDSWEGA